MKIKVPTMEEVYIEVDGSGAGIELMRVISIDSFSFTVAAKDDMHYEFDLKSGLLKDGSAYRIDVAWYIDAAELNELRNKIGEGWVPYEDFQSRWPSL